MKANTYQLTLTLIDALELANSDDTLACCRTGVYGVLEKAIRSLGDESVLLWEHNLETGETMSQSEVEKAVSKEQR